MSKKRSQGSNEGLAGAQWHVSSYSGSGNNCVEHGRLPNGTHAVRDTKDREGGALMFTADAWSSFIEFAKTQDI
ncbi:DUF397 domain-containing protein [Streptantibioticus ferralitis]|uniref:DUF397 domain-containing protein n=1 Tax=Streptantibioticus ferralitis TaxID=236510 RepID=A0ABT5Z3I8_9ACTN|nr:DUF397 domain-containing protein [Streptantibioticus ferralitis]MDF2258398.1 DUF397 domain-containing protein [Streptantibioticus ferralitis]